MPVNYYHITSSKDEFEREEYLKQVNISRFKVSLTRVRLSSHNLAIGIGRYENTVRENRSV